MTGLQRLTDEFKDSFVIHDQHESGEWNVEEVGGKHDFPGGKHGVLGVVERCFRQRSTGRGRHRGSSISNRTRPTMAATRRTAEGQTGTAQAQKTRPQRPVNMGSSTPGWPHHPALHATLDVWKISSFLPLTNMPLEKHNFATE